MSKNLAILAIALLSLSGASFTDASAQLTGPCLGNHLRALRITIGTGDDDLRGGTDNVMLYAQALRRPDWVLIPLRGGLNANARWADRSTHSIDVAIPITGSCPPPPAYITGLRLQTTFRGGTGGDNWNLRSVHVDWVGTNEAGEPASGPMADVPAPARGGYLHRFNGDNIPYDIPLLPPTH